MKDAARIRQTRRDYRLRIGMRFAQQGREFVIEGPLPDAQLTVYGDGEL
jgi:hypothetical protein